MNKIIKYIDRNGPVILTGLSVVGVISTTILAVKATPKAIKVLDEAQNGGKIELIDKIKILTPIYFPTMLTGVATIACILGAQMLNKKHQAALTSAYMFLDTNYKNYKRSALALYGKEGIDKIDEETSKRYIDEEKLKDPLDEEVELFFDYETLRYFESTMSEVCIAESRYISDYLQRGRTTLNRYLYFLGLDSIDYGDDMMIDYAYRTEHGYDNEVGIDLIPAYNEKYNKKYWIIRHSIDWDIEGF